MSEPSASPVRVSGVHAPEPGRAIRVTVEGEDVAVFNEGGKLFAIGAACTHAGGPLEEGTVGGGKVTCPWHGSVFRLEDGTVQRGPAQRPVSSFRVTQDGPDLLFSRP